MDIKQEVLDMLKIPQLSSLASMTLDGKPWTRYVMIQSDAQGRLQTATCIEARKVKQVEQNPEVHLTFGINDPQDLSKPYVQIQGTATISTNQQDKDNAWYDMLSMIFTGPDDPKYAVLYVHPYRIEFNKPGAMQPEIWEK